MSEIAKINIEQKKENFLEDAKKIYLEWKQADKTYNSKGITNLDVRNKYKEYSEKYNNLKKDYENIHKKTEENLLFLKDEIQEMKNDNIKDYTIRTIAQIGYYIEKDNKSLGFDKIVEELGYNNIKEVYKNKSNLLDVLSELNKKGEEKTNQEIQLIGYLEGVKGTFDYSKEQTKTSEFDGIEIDLESDENKSLFKKLLINYGEEQKEKEKKENTKTKKYKESSYEDTTNYYSENVIQDGETFTLELENGETIHNITPEENEIISNDEEVLEKYIDINKKLDDLNINFAWEKRNDLIPEMKKHNAFNEDENFFHGSNILTKKGYENYLQFLIKLTGEKYDKLNINNNIKKIRNINNESIVGEKVNNQTGFKPFGQKLVQNGVFNKYGILDSFVVTHTISDLVEK